MDENSRLFKFCSAFYSFCVWVLIFLAGAGIVYYKLPFARPIINGFIAAEAWIRVLEDTESDKKSLVERRASMAKDAEGFLDSATASRFPDAGKAHEGYTLITLGVMPYPALIDMDGKVIHRWDIKSHEVWGGVSCSNVVKVATHFVDTAELLPDGTIYAQYGELGSPYGCGIIKADKDANVIWSYRGSVHHDFTIDDKNQIYTLEQKTLTAPIDGYEGLSYPLMADQIVAISAEDGKFIRRIDLLDAFKGTPQEMLLFTNPPAGDDKYDFMHTNSIDILEESIAAKFPMFKAGDILISMRASGILAVIRPAEKGDGGKVVWAVRGWWSYQHDAHFLPTGEIMFLDNQGQVDGDVKYSRVVKIDPATSQPTWAYIGNKENQFTTEKVGRIQLLPSGHILVTESQHSRIFEITPDGKMVWLYKYTNRGGSDAYISAIYHAHRYGVDELTFLKGKD